MLITASWSYPVGLSLVPYLDVLAGERKHKVVAVKCAQVPVRVQLGVCLLHVQVKVAMGCGGPAQRVGIDIKGVVGIDIKGTVVSWRDLVVAELGGFRTC